MARLYPIRLEPRLHHRLWGGARLPSRLGRDATDIEHVGDLREPVGEAWLAGGTSRVANGVFRGRTLDEAIDELGSAFVGTEAIARYGPRMPLLAKLIDSGDRLSIQVHPDDAYARTAHPERDDLGKSEAWVVLEANPEAEVLWGWQRDVEPAEVRARIVDRTLEDVLRHVPVAPGDVIHNPPGTVHAIGAGVYLFEIQQASDLTYRLYDYGRRGADGEPRELHVDAALDVADLSASERTSPAPQVREGGWSRLLACPQFVLERHDLDVPAEATTDARSLEVLVLADGEAHLEAAAVDGSAPDPLQLHAGDAVVLPAMLGAYRVAGRGTLFRSFLVSPDR